MEIISSEHHHVSELARVCILFGDYKAPINFDCKIYLKIFK